MTEVDNYDLMPNVVSIGDPRYIRIPNLESDDRCELL